MLSPVFVLIGLFPFDGKSLLSFVHDLDVWFASVFSFSLVSGFRVQEPQNTEHIEDDDYH